VLLRLQNNVVTRLAKAEKYEEAVASLDAMLLLAPRAARLWFERGAYLAKTGNLGAAMASLETFIARSDSPGAKAEAAALLATIKRRLN
jgi:regulator of sirC expression with transglutaminase-like and TPR domain